MQRDQIWWADPPEHRGSRPGHRRPVLIIQADPFNRSRIQTTVVAAINTNVALARAPGDVLLPPHSAGLARESVVNVSQLLTLDRAFLTERELYLALPVAKNSIWHCRLLRMTARTRLLARIVRPGVVMKAR